LSFLTSFPFQISAKLPGGSSFDLTGNTGPLSRQNAAKTPFHATLNVKHFDPVAEGVVQSNQGIAGLVDVNVQLASDGTTLTSIGKIEATRMQLARGGSPAPHPVNIDYSIADNLDTRTGKVSDISVHSGSVAAHVTGTYQHGAQGATLDLLFSATNLPIDQVEQLLPAFGVRLPSGSSLHGGTLTANLAVTGSPAEATIAGPIEIDNTQLAGFDLASKIEGINPFGGKHGGTGIKTVRAEVKSSPQTTQLTNIYGDLPLIGTATGSGTVSPSGALDFNLVATFSAVSGVGAVAGKAVTEVTGLVGGFLHQKKAAGKHASSANGGIPITITGTTSDPRIRANIKAMLR
jgi:AsmA protein